MMNMKIFARVKSAATEIRATDGTRSFVALYASG